MGIKSFLDSLEKEESKKDDDKTDSISPEEPLLNDSFSYNDNKHGFASPGVRRLSRELNINLNIIKGTGLKGRITKDDLNNYIKLQNYLPQHLQLILRS